MIDLLLVGIGYIGSVVISIGLIKFAFRKPSSEGTRLLDNGYNNYEQNSRVKYYNKEPLNNPEVSQGKDGADGKEGQNGKDGESKKGFLESHPKIRMTTELAKGLGEMTGGAVATAAQVAGKLGGDGLRKISKPVMYGAKKVYTLAKSGVNKAKDAVGNSRVGQATKKAITGIKDTGTKIYTSGKQKLSDFGENVSDKIEEAAGWVDDKTEEIATSVKGTLNEASEVAGEAIDWVNNTPVIKGVKSGAETVAKYGGIAIDAAGKFADETAEYAKTTSGYKLSEKGKERLKKILKSGKPVTGTDKMIFGRLFRKKTTKQLIEEKRKKQQAIMDECTQKEEEGAYDDEMWKYEEMRDEARALEAEIEKLENGEIPETTASNENKVKLTASVRKRSKASC